jgi:hypothetical protein
MELEWNRIAPSSFKQNEEKREKRETGFSGKKTRKKTCVAVECNISGGVCVCEGEKRREDGEWVERGA